MPYKQNRYWKKFESATYCVGCGKPGTARCYACAMKERARMMKNCAMPGAQEYRGKLPPRPLPVEQMRSCEIRARHPRKASQRPLAYLILEAMDATKRKKLHAR